MNLIDRIEEEMQSDDEDRRKQSRLLEETYEKAKTKGCEDILNDAFIALCGWSLSTLVGDFDYGSTNQG